MTGDAIRVFDWDRQYAKGRRGVKRVIEVLREKYDKVVDLQRKRSAWRRGDLYVKGLGYVEVKTDFHKDTVFLEVDRDGRQPSGVLNSNADWWCLYYPKRKKLYLFPLSQLRFWLYQHASLLKSHYRVVWSKRKNRYWSVGGYSVPLQSLLEDIPGVVELEVNNE